MPHYHFIKKILCTCLLIGLFSLGWYFLPAVLLAIFPGILLLFYPPVKKMRLTEAIVFVPLVSLASAIVVFGSLKFIPVSFSLALKSIFIGSFLFLLYSVWKKKFLLHVEKAEVLYTLLLIPLFVLFGQLFFNQIVPAGADMATHSYIAKTIQYYNDFPTTYEPIAPIRDFGFEPVGMPSIMAGISLLSNMPIHQSGLLISVLLYPFMGVLVFNFLALFFKKPVALLTAYGLFFLNWSFTSYLSNGAHPTVFSILFFSSAIYFAVQIFLRRSFDGKNALMLAVLFAASFLSHPTPFVAGSYLVAIPTLSALYTLKKNKISHLFVTTTASFFIFFILCFLTSFRLVSQDTLHYIQDWQRNQSYLARIDTSLFTIVPEYIYGRAGIGWSLLIFGGFLISLKTFRKETRWFLFAFAVYYLILLNTDYWFLPLSPLLYPSRTTSTAALVFCYFAAMAIEVAVSYIRSVFVGKAEKSEKLLRVVLLCVLFGFFGLQSKKLIQENFSYVSQNFRGDTSVTVSDLEVMNWISSNTNEEDIIDNNYGDAGIWIPAIAGRRVTNNDAMPHSFDLLGKGIKNVQPTYAFIGEKILYPDHIYITEETAHQNGYELVYQVGGSKLYRLPTQDDFGF